MVEVSVVIAVKNRALLLKEALVSISRQTYSDWECIVVDDHSDEDIASVVESMQDSRFRYVKNTGRPGVAAARNLGNSHAQADWIAVADSDDINLPRRLEVSLKCVQMHPGAEVAYGSICTFMDGGFDLGPWCPYMAYDRETLYRYNFIPHNAVMYKRELVRAVPYNEDLESCEDYDLWLSLSDRHVTFASTAELLALYRRHEDQFTTDPIRKKRMYDLSYEVMHAHAQYR